MTTIKMIQKFLNENGFSTHLTDKDEPQPGTILISQDKTHHFATARVSIISNTITASIFNSNTFKTTLEHPDSLKQLLQWVTTNKYER